MPPRVGGTRGIEMAGASAEGEVNHWPAFVDVLTTVIMVVTFLLVIMSAAVMVLSQRMLERAKAQYEQQHTKDADPATARDKLVAKGKAHDTSRIASPADAADGSSIAELGSVLKSETPIDGQDRLTVRTRETPDTLRLAVKADEQAEDSKGVRVQASDVLLRVDFEPLAVRFDSDSEKKVKDFLASRTMTGAVYEIWSSAPQTSSVSEAQRLAFFRAALTRNLLIRAGIPGAEIKTKIRVTDPTSTDGHNVRVVVKP
ncbi:MAG TPA: hypothetical protein VF638_11195 [Sphingomonas sp.]